jgi:ribose transport system substrate-binding protein
MIRLRPRKRYTLIAALLALLAASGCASSASQAMPQTAGTAGAAEAGQGGPLPSTDSKLNWQQAPCPCAAPTLSGGQYSVALGNGETVTWAKGSALNVVYFAQGESNLYLQADVQGAQDAAKAVGAKLTIVDAQFNPDTQRDQIQNALASGKYNAALVMPVSSAASCSQLTHDAPAAKVPVVVLVQETCGRDNDTGEALWSPGTLSYVGGAEGTIAFFRQWADAIGASLTKPTKAVVIAGPSGNGTAAATDKALQDAGLKYPDLQIVATDNTDYSDAQGLSAAQNLLQAHPDADAVIVEYGGQTPSVISAVSRAGRAGKVAIYDAGFDKIDQQNVENGSLQMTAADFPYSAAYCAVELLAAAHAGAEVPRVVYNDCNAAGGDASGTKALIITKQNVTRYQPEY